MRSLAPVSSLALASSSITVSSCPQADHNADHNHGWNCQFRPTMPLKSTSFTLGLTAQQLISHLGHPDVKICCSLQVSFFTWLLVADLDQQAALPSLSITLNLCSVNSVWDNNCFILGSDLRPVADCHLHFKQRTTVVLFLTCSIPSVIEIHSEGTWLMSSLP